MKSPRLYSLLIFLIIFCGSVQAQISDEEKARLYLTEAQSQFDQQNYPAALEYIEKAETVMSSTSGKILNLKVKALYHNAQYIETQKALNMFAGQYSDRVSQELKNETLSYFVKIEKGFENRGKADREISNNEPVMDDTTTSDNVFNTVEQRPKLIGGQAGLYQKVVYPQAAIQSDIQGRVVVGFTVDEKGNVINPKIIRGIGGGCDQEALRVIKQAKFLPGSQRGQSVKVKTSLSINFRLSD